MALQDTDLFIIGRSNTSYNTSFLNLKTGLDSRYLNLTGGSLTGNVTTTGNFEMFSTGILLMKMSKQQWYDDSGTKRVFREWSDHSPSRHYFDVENGWKAIFRAYATTGGPNNYIEISKADGLKLQYVNYPSNSGDGANKQFVDDQITATRNYVDDEIANLNITGDYLPLTGGTVSGNLTTDGGTFVVKGDGKAVTLKKPDSTKVFQIAPNAGADYSTNIYSYNSGAMRFRVTNNDTTSGYKTAISASWASHTVGSTTYDAKTVISYLQTPTNPGHAANKQYVDDQVAAVPVANIPVTTTASSNVGDMWFNPNDNTLYIKKS